MKSKLEEKNILFLNQNRNIIDLDPFFQRGRIWGLAKKKLFIDTLLKDWGVPKIYLAAYKNRENKVYRYECIDGKQRLTTIFDFFDKKFTVQEGNIEKAYDDLDLQVKENFGKYFLDVEVVEEFNADELSDLYQRLQSGQALNSSEKLKAITGDMSEFVFELSNRKLFNEKIVSKSKRYPHLATVAQSALLCMKNDIVSLKLKDLSRFLNNFKNFNRKSEEARKIVNIFDYLESNFSKADAATVFTNRAIFVSCFYLVAYLMTRGDISKMKIKKFFIHFVKELSEVNKNVKLTMTAEKVFKLKDFQTSILQGADSVTSIRKRHQILLEELVSFDKNVASVINYKTVDEHFKELYNERVAFYRGSHARFNGALLKSGCKSKNSLRGKEALPVYIRHENEHPGNRKYEKKDLGYAINFLGEFICK